MKRRVTRQAGRQRDTHIGRRGGGGGEAEGQEEEEKEEDWGGGGGGWGEELKDGNEYSGELNAIIQMLRETSISREGLNFTSMQPQIHV